MFEKEGAPRADFGAIKRLVVESFQHWSSVEASRLSAALAFYTIMSLAPLLVVAVAVAGLILGRSAAQGEIFNQVHAQAGRETAELVRSVLQNAAGSKPSRYLSAVLGFVVLLFSASGVFTELQDSLDKIWGVHSLSDYGWGGMIRERIWAFGMVLGIGFLLLASLITSTFISAAGSFFSSALPLPAWCLESINSLVSFAVLWVVFGLLYKVVPDVEIRWSDVAAGAAVTSLLFTIGKLLIALYLGKAAVGSPYGTAGSVVVLLVWLYYSAQVFFLGAVFTRLFTERHGSRCAGRERHTRILERRRA